MIDHGEATTPEGVNVSVEQTYNRQEALASLLAALPDYDEEYGN